MIKLILYFIIAYIQKYFIIKNIYIKFIKIVYIDNKINSLIINSIIIV